MTFLRKKVFLAGLPFFIFIIGGSFGLTVITDIRYKYFEHKNTIGLSSERRKALAKTKINDEKITLESTYAKMRENIDINNWENKRGPRPYENPEDFNEK